MGRSLTGFPLVVSRMIVNAIVLDGRTLWFTVPDGNGAYGFSFENDLANCMADEFRDAAP